MNLGESLDEEYEADNSFDTNEYELSTNETNEVIHTLVNIEQKGRPLEYVKGMVRTWCYEELWPHLKFVETEQIQKVIDMNEEEHMIKTLFSRMNITKSNINEQQLFLNTYADTIKRIINDYRAATQDRYKREVLKCK